MNAKAAYRAILAKSEGAGSRGGHIIGHTRSGKPIYASSHESYSKVLSGGDGHKPLSAQKTHEAHPSYNIDDHADAAEAHYEHANAHPRGDARAHGHLLSQAHSEASMALIGQRRKKDKVASPSD